MGKQWKRNGRIERDGKGERWGTAKQWKNMRKKGEKEEVEDEERGM